MKLKKLIGGMLAAALALGMVATPVQAAALKGLTGNYSFEADSDDGWANVDCFCGSPVAISAKDLTASYDVYFPKALLGSFGHESGIGAGFCVNAYDVNAKKNYNIPMCTIDMWASTDGKEIDYWHHDDKSNDNIQKPEYASVKIVGDFVKISYKDAPVDTSRTVEVWDDNTQKNSNGSISSVPAEAGIGFNTDIHSWRLTKESSGKFFVTNVSIKSAGTSVFKSDTSYKGVVGGASNSSNPEKRTDIKVSSFNSSFAPAKAKVTVNAGKTAKVKVATHFDGDKVTVKTNKKAVATATYKKGTLTIKGVKAGKAVITLTSDGVTKKVTVTVK